MQDYLQATLGRRFVKHTEWPPNSPDINPLDFYFWDKVVSKVYEGRYCHPFTSTEELKARIVDVWEACVDVEEIRKALRQFLPRLNAVVEKEGGSIKTVFG